MAGSVNVVIIIFLKQDVGVWIASRGRGKEELGKWEGHSCML